MDRQLEAVGGWQQRSRDGGTEAVQRAWQHLQQSGPLFPGVRVAAAPAPAPGKVGAGLRQGGEAVCRCTLELRQWPGLGLPPSVRTLSLSRLWRQRLVGAGACAREREGCARVCVCV